MISESPAVLSRDGEILFERGYERSCSPAGTFRRHGVGDRWIRYADLDGAMRFISATASMRVRSSRKDAAVAPTSYLGDVNRSYARSSC